jgi:protein ImuB
MFACLCQPSFQQTLFGLTPDDAAGRLEACPTGVPSPLETLAREFSPRVEVHRPHLVSLDIAGLGRLLGTPADIADELRRAAEGRGLRLQVAIAPTRTAALLLALSATGIGAGRSGTPPGAWSRKPGAGLLVVPPGGERDAVAPLPLGVLRQLPFDPSTRLRVVPSPSRNDSLRSLRAGRFEAGETAGADEVVALLRRWGLKTLGDLAGLPSRPLSERLGQHGVMWQRLARGEDLQPLVAGASEGPIEETLDLEWPVEGLEPLSFVLARMCEPLAERLAAQDLAAVVLHLSFRLTSRETDTRELQLPAPMRDPKVLRTLILLHLESHPLPGGVDRLTLRVDAAPARITQFSLLARARPFPEQMATLLARLSALLGERRVGAPALVDSHRPGAFSMTRFSGGFDGESGPAADDEPLPDVPRVALRRFRTPVPARVLVKDGRPARVSMERRGLEGGVVTAAAGPWRTSGDWWRVADEERPKRWSRDEWDVSLSDGALYRVYRDRTAGRWFVDGIVD